MFGWLSAGGRLGLALEARLEVGIGRERGGDRLEGDEAVEQRVVGLVDLAHRPLADLPYHPVLTDVVQAHHRTRTPAKPCAGAPHPMRRLFHFPGAHPTLPENLRDRSIYGPLWEGTTGPRSPRIAASRRAPGTGPDWPLDLSRDPGRRGRRRPRPGKRSRVTRAGTSGESRSPPRSGRALRESGAPAVASWPASSARSPCRSRSHTLRERARAIGSRLLGLLPLLVRERAGLVDLAAEGGPSGIRCLRGLRRPGSTDISSNAAAASRSRSLPAAWTAASAVSTCFSARVAESSTSRAARALRVELQGALGLVGRVREVARLEPASRQLDLRVDHGLRQVAHLGGLRGGGRGRPRQVAARRRSRPPTSSTSARAPPIQSAAATAAARGRRHRRPSPRGCRGRWPSARRPAPPRPRRKPSPRGPSRERARPPPPRASGAARSAARPRSGSARRRPSRAPARRAGSASAAGSATSSSSAGGSSCITLNSTPCIDSASNGFLPASSS